MRTPEDLYELLDVVPHEDAAEPPRAPVLVHALHGFMDAGGAAGLAITHLLEELPNRVAARFDVDQLLDYRARRPRMVFSKDRFTSYDTPELLLHELRLPDDSLLYLLVGPEPDTQWERFVAAVRSLVERLGVRLTIGIHGMPWAAPHTRPVGLTPHASDRELIAGRPRWIGDVEVPGHVDGLIEFRLGEAGHPAMGFTAHVPHYLTTTDFPPAAVTLLDAVSDAIGARLPTQALRDAGAKVLVAVDEQVADSAETLEAIRGLEHQYDAVAAGRALEGPGLMSPQLPEDEVPSADKLAADVEQFLREMDG